MIRVEEAGDAAAIRRVNERAFGRAGEADLVDALREAGAVVLSMVALTDGEVAGHILYSPVEGPGALVGLAPMAVDPSQQRRGLGSRLVRESLARLTAWDGVVVLGHPSYYPRFGFERASRYGLRWEHPCPDESFMVLPLRRLSPGVVRYRREFDQVG